MFHAPTPSAVTSVRILGLRRTCTNVRRLPPIHRNTVCFFVYRTMRNETVVGVRVMCDDFYEIIGRLGEGRVSFRCLIRLIVGAAVDGIR